MNDILWLVRKVRLYPFRAFCIIVGACGTVISGLWSLIMLLEGLPLSDLLGALLAAFIFGHLVGLFLAGPAVLSIYNILYLVVPHNSKLMRRRSQRIELFTMIVGAVCFYVWSGMKDICWNMNWWEQLYNSKLHAPIATWTYPTLNTIAIVGLVGYLVLYIGRIRPLPPLLRVLGLGGLYLGAGLCVVLFIQLSKHDWVLCVYLINLLLIFLKVVKEMILLWQKDNPEVPCSKPRLRWLHRVLYNRWNLPWLALIAAVPLLGIALAVLTLFGQEPDSIIQAWTQTSDWTLSQQVAPPNLPMDMHYLCTVAAGGHRKLVKPLRMGKRHGHSVLVNRQLAVANAFEELLQQRLPRFHRLVRYIYDRYGYPIANHIRSPWAADAVWLLMKPAEWCFLAVLYLFDQKPENRIAVQYPHAPVPK